MSMNEERANKIIRIQADRLNEAMNLPHGTYMSEESIAKLADSKVGEVIKLKSCNVTVTSSIKGLACLLLEKIGKETKESK